MQSSASLSILCILKTARRFRLFHWPSSPPMDSPLPSYFVCRFHYPFFAQSRAHPWTARIFLHFYIVSATPIITFSELSRAHPCWSPLLIFLLSFLIPLPSQFPGQVYIIHGEPLSFDFYFFFLFTSICQVIELSEKNLRNIITFNSRRVFEIKKEVSLNMPRHKFLMKKLSMIKDSKYSIYFIFLSNETSTITLIEKLFSNS